MQWNSVSEFFAMGGYGLYVWGSYAVTALALTVEVWLLLRRRRTPGDLSGRTVVTRDNRQAQGTGE